MGSVISEEEYKVHRTIIYSIVLVFEFIGLFGNINLVFVILRNKSLKSKFGLIMASLAFFHTFCLLFEFVNMGFGIAATFYSYRIHRTVCFYSTFPLLLFHCLQTGTICMISFDLFLAILIPIKYRHFHIDWYFPMLYALPVFYGMGIMIAGAVTIDDSEIPMCNPPASVIPSVKQWWYQLMLAFSFLTIIFYSSAFALLSWKVNHNISDIRLIERRALRTLQVLIVTFLFTRFISTGVGTAVTVLKVNPDYASLVHNYNVLPAIVAYSQNAYVCYFRSTEYRRLLTDQMSHYIPFVYKVLPVKPSDRSTTRPHYPGTTVKF